MFEIITTNGTFWSNINPTGSTSVGWPNIAVAATYVNARSIGQGTLDQLRPQAQDDLDQDNTVVVQINPSAVVAVVNLADSARPTQ